MLTQDQLKLSAAQSAVSYVLPLLNHNSVVGVGTGSTVNFFIDELAKHKHAFAAAVSSSNRSTERMSKHGIKVVSLNDVTSLDVYIDGADEVNSDFIMVKGGGGALTQEKIVASVAKSFVCIVDESKLVDKFGKFPLPVEVVPLARNAVARELKKLGGTPVWREGFITDNNGHILDVANLNSNSEIALQLESRINNIPGVICCGYFAQNKANVVVISGQQGVKILK